MRTLSRMVLLVLAGCVAFDTYAQDKPVSTNDREFVVKASQGVLAEVALASLAQKSAASDGVKKFAQRTLTEQGNTLKAIDAAAAKVGMTPPRNPSEKQLGDLKAFSHLSGPSFDREYIRLMVEAHQAAVMLFEKQMKDGDSPELKALAGETLPVLRERLKIARALKERKAQA
ncbi:MAG TPA: DUF4142 domain-containing protein [Burkholderiales bacterium]|nr:DUF4142 domain-containing protein [Burkholderiales bacterium]